MGGAGPGSALLAGRSTAMRTVSREAAGPEAKANAGKNQSRITELFRLEQTFNIINPPVHLSACHTCFKPSLGHQAGKGFLFSLSHCSQGWQDGAGSPFEALAWGSWHSFKLSPAFQVELQEGAFLN